MARNSITLAFLLETGALLGSPGSQCMPMLVGFITLFRFLPCILMIGITNGFDIHCLHVQSCLTLVTPWTGACQVPLSMEISWQEYWSGLTFPFSEELLYPGIELTSPGLQADALPSEPPALLN